MSGDSEALTRPELDEMLKEERRRAEIRETAILERIADHVFKLAPRPDADILVVTLPHPISQEQHQHVATYLREHFKPKFPNLVTLVVERGMKVDLISRAIVARVAEARSLVRDMAHVAHRTERVLVYDEATSSTAAATIHARDCPGCAALASPEWQERLTRFLEDR